jgi:hypothetical protein
MKCIRCSAAASTSRPPPAPNRGEIPKRPNVNPGNVAKLHEGARETGPGPHIGACFEKAPEVAGILPEMAKHYVLSADDLVLVRAKRRAINWMGLEVTRGRPRPSVSVA